MLAIVLLAVLGPDSAIPFHPIDLTTITPGAARRLECRTVRATLRVGCPPDTIDGITIFGPEDRGDGSERAAYVPDADVNPGDVVTVEGKLRTVRHPAVLFNGVNVTAWWETQ